MTQEFLTQHPFQFNLYRIMSNGKPQHVNSLYKDYNCTPADLVETDTPFRRKVICQTQEDVNLIISFPPNKGQQALYILTPISLTNPED